jgi:hypothetical protein
MRPYKDRWLAQPVKTNGPRQPSDYEEAVGATMRGGLG